MSSSSFLSMIHRSPLAMSAAQRIMYTHSMPQVYKTLNQPLRTMSSSTLSSMMSSASATITSTPTRELFTPLITRHPVCLIPSNLSQTLSSLSSNQATRSFSSTLSTPPMTPPTAPQSTSPTTSNDRPPQPEPTPNEPPSSPQYAWIDAEAQQLIKKAYANHKAIADKSRTFPPGMSITDLEKIGTPYHYPPKDLTDRLALNLMKFLRVFVHAFFREKYDHHAVCLETVAAVPGMVATFHRHLRSLRRMQRDHGWINVLQEEAENERMHLLIFMKVCEPTALERGLVMLAQGIYLSFYSTLYLVSPRAAHRLTGYLEEEAHCAYTDYLKSIDEGKLANRPAPLIARQYYRLNDDATMRDVVLHVRADEAMHRDVNHHFGNMYQQGHVDRPVHHDE